MTKTAKLIFLWAGASFILFPILYILIPSLFGLFLGMSSLSDLSDPALVYLGIIGLTFAVVGILPYIVVLFAWVWLSHRFTMLEKDKSHVAAFTAILALSVAIVVSISVTEFGARIRWAKALEALPPFFGLIWGMLLLPRLMFRALAPGVFIKNEVR